MRKLRRTWWLGQEVLKVLPKEKGSQIGLDEILKRIKKETNSRIVELEDISRAVGLLKDEGRIRAYLDDKTGEKGYYLSSGIGSGMRDQRKLLGAPSFINDTYHLVERLFGVFILMFGAALLIFNKTLISGAAISLGKSGAQIPIFSLLALVVGAVLILISNKKTK